MKPLKPCPFCRGTLLVCLSYKTAPGKYGYGLFYFVCCLDCDAKGPEKKRRSQATDAWNIRIKEETQK